MVSSLINTSASQLTHLIHTKQISPVELMQIYLAHIEVLDPHIHAFTTVFSEQALAQAKVAEDDLMRNGAKGPLHGLPLAVKDLFDPLAGTASTFGSRIFARYPIIPTQHAPFLQRLIGAGAIPIGKTNVSEFGFKGTTDNMVFGPTSSPFDLRMNAGGSSGGSAAAVAAGMAPLSTGSDAGGSIRIPAALCGVVGFKPTFGRIPLHGQGTPDAFLGFSPFLHAGPITRTVEDAALMMQVMSGPSPYDPFSLPDHLDYQGALSRPLSNIKVAYSPDLGTFPVEPTVLAVVESALTGFAEAGMSVERVDIQLPSQEEMSALWEREMAILDAHDLDLFKSDGIDVLSQSEYLDPLFLERLQSAQHLSAVDYRRGAILKTAILTALEQVFDGYDVLVTPTVCVEAIPNASQGQQTIGPTSILGTSVDPLIGWAMTYPINFTGHPALSLPAGFSEQGHPIGLQIIGRRFTDDQVLAIGAAFERTRPWHHYDLLKSFFA